MTTPASPLVSIAVATYNGGKYLREQLDTLIGQTYPNIEIVVSDDGSKDGTLEVLEEYRNKYPNFFVHHNDAPHGIKRNFENAIKYCKGLYISLSDQDDIWMPDKIEKMVAQIGSNALIYHDSLFVDSAGKSLGHSISTRLRCYDGHDCRAFLLCNTVSGHALMFHRKMIELGMPFPDVNHHDWWMAFRAADNGGVKYVDEQLVHYRQHAQSQTDFFNLKRKTAEEKRQEKIKMQQEELAWLEVCAAAPSSKQSFIRKWRDLMKDKNDHIFNFRLFFMSLRGIRSVFAMRKKSIASTFFFILRSSWGDDHKKRVRNLKKRFRRRKEDKDILFVEDMDGGVVR